MSRRDATASGSVKRVGPRRAAHRLHDPILLEGRMTMGSFGFRLIAALLLVALCGLQPVQAGDLDDCHGNVLDKIEPACTAIINNQSRTQDERLKAYTARSQFFANRAKYDDALADADAALRLDPKFVPALQARAY